MALFLKRTNAGISNPLYNTSLGKTRLVVGLGNPGSQYDATRHNIGFAVVDQYAYSHDFDAWHEDKKHMAAVSSNQVGETKLHIVKPQTFMNLSGQAVRSVMDYYKIPATSLLVIHDELDIPFGSIRTKFGGGSAGHNGLKSLIQHVGEDFSRVRLGIGNQYSKTTDAADFVLQKFSADEQTNTGLLIREACAMIEEWLVGADQITTENRLVLLPDTDPQDPTT